MKPQQPSSKKTIYTVICAVVVLAVVYFYFSGSAVPSSEATLESQSASMVGARVLNLLTQIRSLKIDATLFEDPAYLSLLDHSVEIPELPVGRDNPFAPIPGVVETLPETGSATR